MFPYGTRRILTHNYHLWENSTSILLFFHCLLFSISYTRRNRTPIRANLSDRVWLGTPFALSFFCLLLKVCVLLYLLDLSFDDFRYPCHASNHRIEFSILFQMVTIPLCILPIILENRFIRRCVRVCCFTTRQ